MRKILFIVAVFMMFCANAQQSKWRSKYVKKAPVSKWTPKWVPKWTAPAAVNYMPKPAIVYNNNKNIVYSYVDTVTKDAENFFPVKGNIGIGTNAPNAALEIKRNAGDGNNKNFLLSLSNIWAENGLNEPTIMFNNGDNTENYSYWTLGARISGDNTHKDPQVFKIGFKAPKEPNEQEYFSIDSYKGRVKIGYCNSNVDGYKLFVEEGILTEKVKVAVKDSEDWFDNVFNADYKIMPIKELDNYIKTNKHLPDVPTTSDVMTNGIDLGKMNGILLKKIEELTLYMIDIKKELEVAKQQIQELKK